jgi:hypothetical protein
MFSTFSGSNIIDVSEFLGGKIFKFIYSFLFISYILYFSAIMIKFISSNISLIYFSHLDINFIVLLFIIAICILNLLGFKAISRLNIFVLSSMILSIIFLYFSSLSNFTFERIFPILGNGITSTFIDGLKNLSTYSGIFSLLFLFPFISNKKDFKKTGIVTIILYTIALLLVVSALLLSIPQSSHLNTSLSLYFLARQVSLGQYFQNLDALFLLIWIPFILTSLSFSMNFALSIFGQVTHIKYSNELVYSFGTIIYVLCLLITNVSEVNYLNETIFNYISIGFVFISSFVILFLANIKKGIMILIKKI